MRLKKHQNIEINKDLGEESLNNFLKLTNTSTFKRNALKSALNGYKHHFKGNMIVCIKTGGEFSRTLWDTEKIPYKICPCCGVALE